MRSNLVPIDARWPTARRAIHRLEHELARLPQIELRVDHAFTDGVYTRSMFIPAGVALVGAIHRFPCLSMIPYGCLAVATEAGTKLLRGPWGPVESPAGTKRVGYALIDTLFITIHANPTNDRDVDRLEDFLIAKSYDEALESPNMGLLGAGDAG